CHTGLVWDRVVDGRVLRFHLAGINNQNFLMLDEETGSWWQQVTGECILGPLRGKRLRRISSDEITLAAWRSEHPESTVVKFDPRYRAGYPDSNWERRVERLPAPGARELVVGIELNGVSRAYRLSSLREQSPLNTQVGRTPIVIVVAADENSVRSFLRPHVDGKLLEFYRRPQDGVLIDSATASAWNFAGRAVSGPLTGRTLESGQNTKDYWFDWKRHHPQAADSPALPYHPITQFLDPIDEQIRAVHVEGLRLKAIRHAASGHLRVPGCAHIDAAIAYHHRPLSRRFALRYQRLAADRCRLLPPKSFPAVHLPEMPADSQRFDNRPAHTHRLVGEHCHLHASRQQSIQRLPHARIQRGV